jgi:hypothetical protein
MNNKFEKKFNNNEENTSGKISRRKLIKTAIGAIASGLLIKKGIEKLQEPEKIENVRNFSEGIYFALTGERRRFDFIGYDDFIIAASKNEIPSKIKEKLLKTLKKNLESKKNLKINIETKIIKNIKNGLDFIKAKQNDHTILIALWKAGRDLPPSGGTVSMGIIKKNLNNGFIVWDPNNGELVYKLERFNTNTQGRFKDLSYWEDHSNPMILILINPKLEIIIPEKEIEKEIQKFKKEQEEKKYKNN